MNRTKEITYTIAIESLKKQAILGYMEKMADEEERRNHEKDAYLQKMASCPVDHPEYNGMIGRKFDSLGAHQTGLGLICNSECGSSCCEKISISSLRNLAANMAMVTGRR